MDELGTLNHELFLHAVHCARRGLQGEWVLHLDEPHHDDMTHRQFIAELLRAVLTPPEQRIRNGEIDHAIQDTTTGPLDAGGGT